MTAGTWYVKNGRTAVNWTTDVSTGVATVDIAKLVVGTANEQWFLFARAGQPITTAQAAAAQAETTGGPVPAALIPSNGVAPGGQNIVSLAQAGQTPSQVPVAAGTAAVGSLAVAARADHAHPNSALALLAASFFGDGSNGDLTVTAGTTNYNGVSYYNNVTVTSTGILSITLRPIFIKGTLTIQPGGQVIAAPNTGTANLSGSGAKGTGGTGVGAVGTPSGGSVKGGGNGGAGGAGSAGSGGAGGTNVANDASYGDGWYRRAPECFSGMVWSPVRGLSRFTAGAGGGAGAGDGTNSGGNGGDGGGATIINAKAVVNNGVIKAPGNNGSPATVGNCGGGGGGGGGVVVINTTAYTGTGTVTATAGTGGAGVGTGVAGSAGLDGLTITNVWS